MFNLLLIFIKSKVNHPPTLITFFIVNFKIKLKIKMHNRCFPAVIKNKSERDLKKETKPPTHLPTPLSFVI